MSPFASHPVSRFSEIVLRTFKSKHRGRKKLESVEGLVQDNTPPELSLPSEPAAEGPADEEPAIEEPASGGPDIEGSAAKYSTPVELGAANQLDKSCKCCGFLYSSLTTQSNAVTYQVLRSKASNGCRSCEFLVQVIESSIPMEDREYGSIRAADRALAGRSRLIWSYTMPNQRLKQSLPVRKNQILELYIENGPVNPFPLFLRTAKKISGDTSSVNCFKAAKRWIKRCSETHDTCLAAVDNPLPNRVLDLKSEDTSIVRLYITRNERASYVCLSYCWGSLPVAKTTRETIHERCKGIVVSTLPTTFRQTIAFVRKLGIRFLWIDSLCIIQNDIADWQRESSQMANIYRNSFVTIAAAKSSDVEGGLFSQAPSEHVGKTIKYSSTEGVTSRINVRKPLEHCYHWGESQKEKLPLFLRGWTLQERLLAPRVLNFTPDELTMECGSQYICECSPGGKMATGPKVRGNFVKPESQTDEQYKEELLRYWLYLIEQYSILNLTMESDKLPAISGIANLTQDITKESYLAGLWEGSLPQALCWYRSQKVPIERRAANWRAPTWSWASIDAPVFFYLSNEYTNFKPVANPVEVVLSGCETIGDPTGQIRSGFLVISGILEPHPIPSAEKFRESELGPEDVLALLGESFDTLIDDKDLERVRTFYQLPVIAEYRESTDEYCIKGLILMKTQTSTSDVPNLNRILLDQKSRVVGGSVSPIAFQRVGFISQKVKSSAYMEKNQKGKEILVII